MPTTSPKRTVPHTTHGESRIKTGKTPGPSKPHKKVLPPRWVAPSYVVLTAEEYDLFPWEEIFGLGVE